MKCDKSVIFKQIELALTTGCCVSIPKEYTSYCFDISSDSHPYHSYGEEQSSRIVIKWVEKKSGYFYVTSVDDCCDYDKMSISEFSELYPKVHILGVH